ncbi:MAG: restriction endonuclease subunit S [Acetobacter sp.]|nr:restriction endonuclease subunit S [Acetobacter sp.]
MAGEGGVMPVYPSEKAQKTSSVENEWVKVRLGDVCDVYQPETISEEEMCSNGAFPVFGANGKIGYYDRYNHEKPEVLVGCRGSCCAVNMSEPRSWITGNAMVVHPKDERLNQSFLYYLLMGGINLRRYVTGSLQPQITKASLLPVILSLPPPPEQKQISALLGSIEKAIDLERRCEESLTTIKRAAMHVVFNPANKVGWKYYPLEEVFTTRQGYTPKTSEASYWKNGTIPFVTMEDIRKYGQRLEKAHRYVTEVAIKGSGVFPAGSFIISTSATIGEHALITVPFLTNQRFTCLILKPAFEKRLERDFIFYYLYMLGQWCRRHVNIGTKFAQVQMSDFRKFSFPIPPLHEQQEIVDFLTTLDQKLDIHRRKRACLENIFRLFLPNLTRGTLRFTDLPEGCF